MGRRIAALAVMAMSLAAACTPPPSNGQTVPSYFPPCTGSPSCLVITNGAGSAESTRGGAVSDDGRIMLTGRSKEVEEDVLTYSLALVGIDDHWYREIARTAPNGMVGSVMSRNGQRVLVVGGPLASPAKAADGSSLVGETGTFIYDGATKKVSRVTLPPDVGISSLSDDWRFAAGTDSARNVVLIDLEAVTSQVIGSHGYGPVISADGSVVVWADGPFEGGVLPGRITRYDRSDGSTTDLGRGAEPSVSGDGSRIVARTNQGWGHLDSILYREVGDTDWTVIAQDTSADGYPRITADGRHLFYGLSHDMLGGRLYDLDLSTGTTSDFGPFSVLAGVSSNGNHVLYWNPLGTFRWNR